MLVRQKIQRGVKTADLSAGIVAAQGFNSCLDFPYRDCARDPAHRCAHGAGIVPDAKLMNLGAANQIAKIPNKLPCQQAPAR
jgi:hypothetical protein